MNFVAQVEDHLRDLGAEARKNYPGVKEASERAIIHLRSLQTQYVAAVRRAGASTSTNTTTSQHQQQHQQQQQTTPSSSTSTPSDSSASLPPRHPTTALFQSQDVLRPFLLAANHPDASHDLLVIALESIQHLLRGDAVCPDDGIQISRVLVIQSWGCAGTLGLVSNVASTGSRRGDVASATGASTSGGATASGTGGSLGMAAGMIHAASGALGGITGMVLGGHHHQGAQHYHYHGSAVSSLHHHHHHHHPSNRSVKEDQSIALKILRTITMLADSRSVTLTEDVLGECLLVCLILGAGQKYNEHHGRGTASMGATIRDRFTSSSSGAANSNAPLGISTKDGSNSVKRAAIATMNQLLSITFERAKEVMMEQPLPQITTTRESSILLVAERTLSDLCNVVCKFSIPQKGQSQLDLIGPFSGAAKEGISPSPTTCLALVDMIMKQIGGDLFQTCFNYFHETTIEEQQMTNHGVDFATQIICQAFKLGHSLLGSQYYYFVTKLSLDSSHQEGSQQSSASNLIEFSLYYYNISLTTTLMTHYLSSASEEFYERFDAYACEKNQTSETPTCISKLGLDMMHQLISFVTDATEAYHKSDDFEDGYIFTQSERESLDIGKSIQSVNRATSQTQPDISAPNEKLWRAFLALVALVPVVRSCLKQVMWLDSIGRKNKDTDDKDDNLTGCLIAKAASDFATSSASNRERILHLLMAAHGDDQSILMKSHANLSADVNETEEVKSTWIVGDIPIISDSENSNAASAIAAKVTDSMFIDAIELPACDVGATAWLAFKCILLLVKSLKSLAISFEANEGTSLRLYFPGLINGSFVPSVSMLQHFIRRMLGSPVIVTRVLDAYQNLAYAAMSVDCQSTNMRRQAILTSLCKLCLPSWGKRRPNCHLKESNIEALWTLLWIIHFNFENIYEEWDIILSTLDQLAIIQIPSPKLPTSYLEKAASIAGCLTRLPLFTTAFSSGALSQFTTSLVKLSEQVSFEQLTEQSGEISREYSESSNLLGDDDVAGNGVREASIGGKLLSFAGRAFGGGGSAQSPPANNISSLRRSQSSTLSKTYSENLREATLSQLATMNISTPGSIIRKIPLPLLFAVTVAEANSYRLPIFEETFASHLCEIVARSSSSELKSFAMQVLIHFMPLSLSQSDASLNYGFRPRMTAHREHNDMSPLEVIAVEYDDPEEIQHVSPQLLKILCHTIHRSTQVDTAENCLHALAVVLEGEGHNVAGDNLITVIRTLSELSGCERQDIDDSVDRSAKQWANVSSLAFQNLKLLLDDFLEPMSSSAYSTLKSIEARDALLDCCVEFGKSRHDLNTSLTATGMLWSLADRDSSPGTVDAVLSNLALLALDNRPELRNCSVNTLFSCVVGLGDQFSDDQWEKCIDYTIFGILSGISTAIEDAETKRGPSISGERYKVAVHHSRDSVRKQWATTQILVLRGLERVLRSFFTRLLSTISCTTSEPWFFQSWKEILRLSYDCSILAGEGEMLDMRLAGIELMVLCSQLSCQAGIAAAGTARVGTNMEVVGGALRSVRAAVEDRAHHSVGNSADLNQTEVDACRRELFAAAFDTLDDFREYLAKSRSNDNEGSKSFVTNHSQLTQVVTKLVGELTKLYECCKCNEMLPGQCELELDISIEDDNGYENRFLQILLVIAAIAGNEKNSRYLNQVQRGILSLLQSMASNSSLRAFKALITISGDFMFVKPNVIASKAITSNDDDDTVETLEHEAAKTVASAFDSDHLSNVAKVIVMCSVLGEYLKHAEEKRASFQYHFFTKVIDSGLDAAEQIESKNNAANDKLILNSMWDRMIATVSSLLLPPADDQYDGYAYQSKSIVNIVAIVLLHLPQHKILLAEPMLENGAKLAVEVAFTCDKKDPDDEDEPYSLASEGAVHVFLACFMGLCQKIPTCLAVTSLTNQILGETFETGDGLCVSSGQHSKTRQSLAIAVCESLRTVTSQDLLVSVFPLLCRLTAAENDGLRRAAGNILGGVNLSDIISRERERADEANTRAKEIEEENNAMLEEIEYLQSENEELQRQLAVFSESSLVS